ncbi:hypothetical protein AVEN_130525-1 [Araneus ventricosus]|uniref:Uncharacterized protein n=1 Tax=Araneus ventricosus TaxID=182803 RepID=A0A4Y2EKJ2_ARAVE|nr:hypothetical protein AVEN_130525-1 [Araneus ventricosus]
MLKRPHSLKTNLSLLRRKRPCDPLSLRHFIHPSKSSKKSIVTIRYDRKKKSGLSSSKPRMETQTTSSQEQNIIRARVIYNLMRDICRAIKGGFSSSGDVKFATFATTETVKMEGH